MHISKSDCESGFKNLIKQDLYLKSATSINLSAKEVKLLSFLMQYPGQLLTHKQIHQSLWTETDQPNRNVLIRLLRSKIESNGATPLIQIAYRRGYRFR